MDFDAWLDRFEEAVSSVDPVHIPQSPRDQHSEFLARVVEVADQPEELSRFLNRLAVEVSPVTSDTSGSSDKYDTVEHELRRFRRRPGRVSETRQQHIQSIRESSRRANAHRFGNTFHLESLFNGSVWGHEVSGSTTDESPVEEEGAVGYDTGAQQEIEFWDQLSLEDISGRLPSDGLDTGRSFLG